MPRHEIGKWRRYGAKREPTRRDYWIGLSCSWLLLILCLRLANGHARRGQGAGPPYMPALELFTPVVVASLCIALGVWNAIQLWRTRADS